MSNFKLLSAGLLAATMLTTPVMAREHHLNRRHVATDIDAGATPDAGYPDAGYVDGRFCVPAPRVDAFATAPWENEPACEPAPAY
jgi:hypothetical protein